MFRCKNIIATLVGCALAVVGGQAVAQHASAVLSFDAGATPAPDFPNPAAALGEPERYSGEGTLFPSVVSPFSPPFLSSEIVSVGEGGHLTLRLSHYAIPKAAGPEIGVFENLGIVDTAYPSGQAGTPATAFLNVIDSAVVEVSANGTDWVSLGNTLFDVPANGYTDLTDPFSSTPGSVGSDFHQPFIGSLSDFDGLPYYDASGPDMLDLLNGSGGGKWLDISGLGLERVGYVRFSLANDGDEESDLKFEIDAVTISSAAVGGIVPEPTTLLAALVGFVLVAVNARRRARR